MKRWTALLVTAAAIISMAGCKTTVVNRDVPVPTPDHHDDHRDDHRPPPPPDHR
jgi:hypothetical protein